MPRDYKLYLRDILEAISRINDYIAGIDQAAFKADTLRVDGVLFNLMTIGEAVKNIPAEVQAQMPDVHWRDIGRFRDRVVHHYFTLDLNVVWEIVTVYLPVLRDHTEKILQDLKDDNNGEK